MGFIIGSPEVNKLYSRISRSKLVLSNTARFGVVQQYDECEDRRTLVITDLAILVMVLIAFDASHGLHHNVNNKNWNINDVNIISMRGALLTTTPLVLGPSA